ncbi:MAG TPA: alpha-amylase family glycosyl hydrolase [Nocardioidaceae bacterium]|nr:alpha-amylase family glycosyl hydrolase [Nocardioidaceae bacterium]
MTWWENAVVYQIYPRSFADSTGDGEGDLGGIRERLTHLVELGVDAVWLSPFYPSPMNDSGYDVSDYCAVDPRFGTLDDLDALLDAARAVGVRIIVDIVPNHCSSDHPLFQAALAAAPGSPERDLFVFRDEPNNWPSFFGGSAWTQVSDGQYYLHLFDSTQPDWNWRNPAVPALFEDVLRFWLDRGVAGFRVDVGNALYKAAGLPDVPDDVLAVPIAQGRSGTPYQDQPELDDHYRSWRAVLDSYGTDGYPGQRIMVGETWADDPSLTARWIRVGMHQSFDFRLIGKPWDAAVWQSTIAAGYADGVPIGTAPWAIGNHDVPRLVTRLGIDQVHHLDQVREMLHKGKLDVDLARGTARARAAALIVLGLPGSSYVYQGDELGLPEYVDLAPNARQDPVFLRTGGDTIGRDGCRIPLPWAGDAAPYDFSSNADTWLPQPADWAGLTVAAQTADVTSTYSLYRDALARRRTINGELVWLESGPNILTYRRGDSFQCFANFGEVPVELPSHDLALTSGDVEDGKLAGNSAAWLWL